MQANKTPEIFSYEKLLVIVGGGEVDTALLWRFRREGAAIIAADGGANICATKRIMPDAIIGDMDSIADKEYWQDKSKLIEVEEQETTDFEKCLMLSEAPVTIAIGMAGERVDHTLANLDILLRYGSKRRLAIA
ncbi:Thiamin pyrophosphokinase, partial [hydrothermal vent metagenome]